MMRRTFLRAPVAGVMAGSLAPLQASPDADSITQTVVLYRQGDVFRALGMIDRKELASGRSAGKVIQAVLDLFKPQHGGRLALEPGLYPLDDPLRVHDGTAVTGSGASTVLSVTAANKAGVGILCDSARGISISDLWVDGNLWSNQTSEAGIVLDHCVECRVEGVTCRGFHKYGFHVRNNTGFTKVQGCSGCNNQVSNFFLENLDLDKRGWNRAPIGDIIPNLVSDCYAFGGGNGFALSRGVCQDIVGCMVYQAGEAAFYVKNFANSTLISGCRSFQGENQAVLVENSSEVNISSSIFCWHKGHGIEVRNCTWGTISANEIIDSGASSPSGGKYGLYMHTDVKGIQVTGNCVWSWRDQWPMAAGVFEDEACQDNNISSNLFNEFTQEAIISKGKNTLLANNLSRKHAYTQPEPVPFAKPHPLRLTPPFDRTRLEEYFRTWYSRASGR